MLIGRQPISRARSHVAHRRFCLAILALGVVALSISGCSHNYRSMVIKTGPAKDIRLGALWNDLATAGRFDPELVTLQSLRLEYSEAGVLVALSLDAWTDQHGLLQVGFAGGDSAGRIPVQISGGVAGPYPRGGLLNATGYAFAASIFEAIDLVGPSQMIALLAPAGSRGMYSFTSAYQYTTPLQPISPSAVAYRWNGSGFVTVPPADDLRQFAGGYQYLMGFTEKLVSSSSSDGMSTAAWQGSDKPIYFIIPTPTG